MLAMNETNFEWSMNGKINKKSNVWVGQPSSPLQYPNEWSLQCLNE